MGTDKTQQQAIAKLNLPEVAGLKKALEEAGLKRALEEVRAHAAGYKESGLSPLSFWIGLINIAASSFLLGRAPEWYWVWSVSSRLTSLSPSRCGGHSIAPLVVSVHTPVARRLVVRPCVHEH